MTKQFYRENNVDAVRKIITDEIKDFVAEAQVKTVSNNKSQATVSINGSYNQTPAYIQQGLTISPGDWVFMIRSKRTGQWAIIAAYINPSSANTSGSVAGAALAPTDLTLVPAVNAFFARWAVGVDTTGLFEVEVANDTAEAGAVTLLIAGSTLPYVTTVVKYIRVRTVSKTWVRSGWTAWVSVTPITTIGLGMGGTGANLSVTGPGYLKQATSGATVTVGAIAQADLPVFTGDSGSGGVKGAVPAPAAGDAAAIKFLKASGSWSVLPPSFDPDVILVDSSGNILVDDDGNVLTE